jgi:hypothetical protein
LTRYYYYLRGSLSFEQCCSLLCMFCI